nr:RecName: Full=10 kDa cell wall protein [Nicotiana tabacum]
VTVGHVF